MFKETRENAGMTLFEASVKAGVSETVLATIEMTGSPEGVTPRILRKLEGAYGVSFDAPGESSDESQFAKKPAAKKAKK